MRVPHPSRRLATAAVVLVLAGAMVAWVVRPETREVETAPATRGPMRATVDEDGRTRVRDRFVVAAPVSGRLERLALREGMVVTPGQIVAWIAPAPLDETTRRQAEARLLGAEAQQREAAAVTRQVLAAEEQARREERRRETLLTAGAISPEQYEQALLARRSREDERAGAESRARAAGAAVEAARAALLALGGGGARGTAVPVRAPAGGTVLRVPETSERVVAAGTPVLELGDPGALEVVVDVLSTDAVRLRPGARVDVVEWGGDAAIEGRVRLVEPAAFTRVSALGVDEQRVNVVVDLVRPPASLGDGYRVETRLVVWEGADVLQVPASAVFQRGGAWCAYVAVGGRARLRPIGIGHRTGAAVEVTRGLAAGAEVILFPSDLIEDGTRVTPRRG